MRLALVVGQNVSSGSNEVATVVAGRRSWLDSLRDEARRGGLSATPRVSVVNAVSRVIFPRLGAHRRGRGVSPSDGIAIARRSDWMKQQLLEEAGGSSGSGIMHTFRSAYACELN